MLEWIFSFCWRVEAWFPRMDLPNTDAARYSQNLSYFRTVSIGRDSENVLSKHFDPGSLVLNSSSASRLVELVQWVAFVPISSTLPRYRSTSSGTSSSTANFLHHARYPPSHTSRPCPHEHEREWLLERCDGFSISLSARGHADCVGNDEVITERRRPGRHWHIFSSASFQYFRF